MSCGSRWTPKPPSHAKGVGLAPVRPPVLAVRPVDCRMEDVARSICQSHNTCVVIAMHDGQDAGGVDEADVGSSDDLAVDLAT